MTPRFTFIAALLFILALATASCTEDKVDPNACDTLEVTYNDGAADILNASCAVSGCHVNGEEFPFLDSFGSASVASTGVEFLPRINHDPGFSSMPPGSKLDQCEIDIITAWIENGSPE